MGYWRAVATFEIEQPTIDEMDLERIVHAAVMDGCVVVQHDYGSTLEFSIAYDRLEPTGAIHDLHRLLVEKAPAQLWEHYKLCSVSATQCDAP